MRYLKFIIYQILIDKFWYRLILYTNLILIQIFNRYQILIESQIKHRLDETESRKVIGPKELIKLGKKVLFKTLSNQPNSKVKEKRAPWCNG